MSKISVGEKVICTWSGFCCIWLISQGINVGLFFELVGVCIKLALISSSYSIRNHMTTLLLISSMTHSVWNIFVQPPMHISNFDIPITSLYLNSRNIEVKHLCFFKRRGHATLEHIGATSRNRRMLAHK